MKWFLVVSLSIFIFACSKTNAPSDPLVGPDPKGEVTLSSSTDIGNGGDLIRCQRRLPNFRQTYHDGWYTLDYAEFFGKKYSYFESYNLKSYLMHIRSLVEKSAPELLDSFEEYLEQLPFVKFDFENLDGEFVAERLWVPTEKNEEVNDENPIHIPINCRMLGSRKLKFHQIVVRKEFFLTDGTLYRVRYSYDVDLMNKIGNKPLQMSMLLVHEWLWDLYPDTGSRRLRRANRALHSVTSRGVSDLEVRRLLNLEEGRGPEPR